MLKSINKNKFFKIKRRFINLKIDKTKYGRPIAVLAQYKDNVLIMQFTTQPKNYNGQLMKIEFIPSNASNKQSYLQTGYKIHNYQYLKYGNYLNWKIPKIDLMTWAIKQDLNKLIYSLIELIKLDTHYQNFNNEDEMLRQALSHSKFSKNFQKIIWIQFRFYNSNSIQIPQLLEFIKK